MMRIDQIAGRGGPCLRKDRHEASNAGAVALNPAATIPAIKLRLLAIIVMPPAFVARRRTPHGRIDGTCVLNIHLRRVEYTPEHSLPGVRRALRSRNRSLDTYRSSSQPRVLDC
jgi:hypothetical protein